jgi:hypothetical protein
LIGAIGLQPDSRSGCLLLEKGLNREQKGTAQYPVQYSLDSDFCLPEPMGIAESTGGNIYYPRSFL